VAENFVAGIGFVPRTDIKQTYGNFSLGPRPNKWGILQVKTGAGFNYITNFDQVLLTRTINFSPLGIRFKSGEEFSYSLSQQYENLMKDFQIYPGFEIPSGEYTFWYQNILMTSAGSRNIAGSMGLGSGDFYNGRREDLKLTLAWKVAVPLYIGGNYSLNHVTLPEGDFNARIYQMNLNILFSPTVTLYNYFQYDNASEKMGWQSRFQWIIKPGNEIILAWTSGWTKPEGVVVMNESALRLKVKYNIRF
jgi:hypothetical protein